MHIQVNDAGSIDIQSERDMMTTQHSLKVEQPLDDHIVRSIMHRLAWTVGLILLTGALCLAVNQAFGSVETTHDIVAARSGG